MGDAWVTLGYVDEYESVDEGIVEIRSLKQQHKSETSRIIAKLLRQGASYEAAEVSPAVSHVWTWQGT